MLQQDFKIGIDEWRKEWVEWNNQLFFPHVKEEIQSMVESFYKYLEEKSKMKKYTGVKEILAKPMNRKEYNDYRGWELPSDENGEDEGFLVEYVQSETSPNVNHPEHKGYISWSPKDVFEESYVDTDVNIKIESIDDFQPHQIRVWEEFCELNQKCLALINFTDTDFFKDSIDLEEQKRLKQQLIVMATYSAILIDRINNFK
jgi:hypothetical protein